MPLGKKELIKMIKDQEKNLEIFNKEEIENNNNPEISHTEKCLTYICKYNSEIRLELLNNILEKYYSVQKKKRS